MDGPRLSTIVSPAHTGNYARGRQNTPVDLIVLHTTEADRGPGTKGKPSAVYWFANPEAKASAHYVVGREDGSVWQCVAEGDTAFHAGNREYNRRSIGIEVEGFAARRDTWTPEVMTALTALCADLLERHQIPLDRHHLIGHREVPDGHGGVGGAGHHSDPGPHLPWDDLLESIHLELAARREQGWQDAGAGRP
jgi:N-acetyl-anhydromuramyl-L-alanine amidase AmpD